MCFISQLLRKMLVNNSLPCHAMIAKNLTRRSIHTTRFGEKRCTEYYEASPHRGKMKPLHLLCAFAAISTGILSGGIISKSVADLLRKNGVYVPDDEDDDNDQNEITLPPPNYCATPWTQQHPMTDPFFSSTQGSSGLLTSPGLIASQQQNETNINVFLHATIELCNKLSEGIENPETLVLNFNQTLEYNGHSPIQVPQSVIDSSKTLFLNKNTNNPMSSIFQRDNVSTPRSMLSLPETATSETSLPITTPSRIPNPSWQNSPPSFTSPYTLVPTSNPSPNQSSLNYFSSTYVARTEEVTITTSSLNSPIVASHIEVSPYI